MSKHTAGPWEISKHATPAYHPQFGVYAPAANDHAIVTGPNAEADARLIAAAPDLLAALKEMLSIDDWTDENIAPKKLVDKAFAAIAKAESNTAIRWRHLLRHRR